MWIYGAPFSGKTTLADSAPDPLMLNTDGNAVYVTAPYVTIKDEVTVMGRITKRKFAWEVFKEYIDELEKKQNDFKTIVVDLVNDTYELCRLYMFDKLGITHESDDTFRAWDKVRTEYLSTMRRLINLPYDNIILISHEDSTKDLTKKSGDKISSVKPKMQDKVADAIAGMVGFVGRVYVDEGKHLLSIKNDEVIYGGGRLGINNVVIPLEWEGITKLFEQK
jgi:phage nucleotide-binding protein